ncbi:MAG: hypothetical protein HW390_2679 [Candidatus Brocadiaceae bacterium]|nr:hypothetical protein [Candidatus Brocadiaceae bacterium]
MPYAIRIVDMYGTFSKVVLIGIVAALRYYRVDAKRVSFLFTAKSYI